MKLSSSKARSSMLRLVSGLSDPRARAVTTLITLQSAYFGLYYFSPGVYQRKLNLAFSYSQNHRSGAVFSFIGHRDFQSYLASTAILSTIGYKHAVTLGSLSFLKFIAAGVVGGILVSELAYALRGKQEGWMFKTSGLAATGPLLIYHSLFSTFNISRISPFLALGFLIYGNYYSDANVAGAAVGTILGTALLTL